jgi:hypothetical protein
MLSALANVIGGFEKPPRDDDRGERNKKGRAGTWPHVAFYWLYHRQ